jgi:hypothetical protein
MKKIFIFSLMCFQLNVFAEEVNEAKKESPFFNPMGLKDAKLGVVQKKDSNENLKVEDVKESVRSTLNLDEKEFSRIMSQVEPEVAGSVAKVVESMKEEDQDKVLKILQDNKIALFKAYITGEVPKEVDNQLSDSIEGYKKLSDQERKAIFLNGSKVAGKLLFESIIKTDGTIGYLLGSETSTPVVELNTKLLNLRTITVGDFKIENVHMEVQAGYPQSGFVLLSGKLRHKDSPVTYEGQILSLKNDDVKEVLDLSIANARVNYEILPWLEAYGGLNVGFRSYADGNVLALDPRVGIEVNQDFDSLKLNAFAEGGLRIAEGNAFFNCGGSVGLNILDNDHVVMDAAFMNRISLESDPRMFGNSVETFNGIVLKGRF